VTLNQSLITHRVVRGLESSHRFLYFDQADQVRLYTATKDNKARVQIKHIQPTHIHAYEYIIIHSSVHMYI